jgi:hypothetical protein
MLHQISIKKKKKKENVFIPGKTSKDVLYNVRDIITGQIRDWIIKKLWMTRALLRCLCLNCDLIL